MHDLTYTGFWCQGCRKDVMCISRRRFLNKKVGEAWNAKCPHCGKHLVRLIGISPDPYHKYSKKIRQDRMKHKKDILQIGDPGFDVLYPQHKREKEEKKLST